MLTNELKKKTKTQRRVDFAEITRLMGSLNPLKHRDLMNRMLDRWETQMPTDSKTRRLIDYLRHGPICARVFNRLQRRINNEKG